MNPLIRWGGTHGACPDCRWLSSRLGYYLEGALRPRAMRRANDHLDECPSCQRSASLLEESLSAARGLRTMGSVTDFEDAVWEKIRISREIQRHPSTLWSTFRSPKMAWWAGGLAVASAATMVTIMVTGGSAPVSDRSAQASWSDNAMSMVRPLPSAELATTSAPVVPTSVPVSPGTGGEAASRKEPSSELVASALQAGAETARPQGPQETVASTQGAGRLEP